MMNLKIFSVYCGALTNGMSNEMRLAQLEFNIMWTKLMRVWCEGVCYEICC